jgi:hypothetical protein
VAVLHKIHQIEAVAPDVKWRLTHLEEETEDQSMEDDAHEDALEELGETDVLLLERLDSHESSISEHSGRLDDHDGQHAGHVSSFEGVQTELDTLGGTVSSNSASIESLEGAVTGLDGAIVGLSDEQDLQGGRLDALELAADDLATDLGDLTGTVATLSGDLAIAQGDISAMQDALISFTQKYFATMVVNLSGTYTKNVWYFTGSGAPVVTTVGTSGGNGFTVDSDGIISNTPFSEARGYVVRMLVVVNQGQADKDYVFGMQVSDGVAELFFDKYVTVGQVSTSVCEVCFPVEYAEGATLTHQCAFRKADDGQLGDSFAFTVFIDRFV